MTDYFNTTVIVEWCTLTAAIMLLDKKTGIWQLFTLWMLLTLFTETTGWYLHNFKGKDPNALPFNLLMILRNLFFIWLFENTRTVSGKSIYTIMATFLLFALTNLLFLQGFWQYNFYSESFANITVTILCCFFIFSLVTQPEYINLLKFEYFWLVIGLLFYSMGSAFLYNFYEILAAYKKQTGINIGLYLNYGLNILLSCSLIIAFICRRKATR